MDQMKQHVPVSVCVKDGSMQVHPIDECRPIKIYKLNGCDWYAAFDMESAIEQACKDTGLDREELIEDPRELEPSELDHLIFVDEEQDGEGEKRRFTFRQQLNNYIINGEKPPFMFASTEY